MDLLKKTLENISAGRLLDICSGRGEFINSFSNYLTNFSEIICIDNIDLPENTFRLPNLKFLKMDAENLNFPKNYFDVITLSNSLHHLENTGKVFAQIKKIVKDNGFIIINEMFSDEQDNAQMTHVMLHHFFAGIDRETGGFHKNTFTKNQILEMVKEVFSGQIELMDYKNAKTEGISIEYLNEVIEKILAKVKDDNIREFYKKEAEKITNNFKQYGFELATQLLLVLKQDI